MLELHKIDVIVFNPNDQKELGQANNWT